MARGLGSPGGRDSDRFDAAATHYIIEETASGRALATWRMQVFANAAAAQAGYSGQFHDLGPLAAFPQPLAELGRFCLAPGVGDPDVLRLAWGSITGLVDAGGIGLLFGCTSLPGCDPARHAATLARLEARHAGPAALRPAARRAGAIALAAAPAAVAAPAPMPPLLRAYLAMGGWVGRHAVPDPDLDTLHVFTALAPADVPPARARALRELSRASRCY